jgi:hypothetical protein
VTDWPRGMTVKPIVAWPGAETKARQRGNFSAAWAVTLDVLDRELHYLGAKDVLLQVAIPANQFRLDGFPRATARQEHPGIILTMNTNVGALSYPCDTFLRWEDNLRAVALALEALRKVDRYGVTKRGEQYQGFLALEARPADEWTDTEAVLTWLRTITDRIPAQGNTPAHLIRLAQRRTHPDAGGTATDFDRVTRAEHHLRKAGLL